VLLPEGGGVDALEEFAVGELVSVLCDAVMLGVEEAAVAG